MINNIIDEKTRICGIIGDPVSQSLSPIMHNTAFRSQGLNFIYHTFPVKEDGLGSKIEELRKKDFIGANVTIPFKSTVLRYLDRIDEKALRIGAVNTIVNDNGMLVGYNTDGEGTLRALLSSGVDLRRNGKVLILGAGGSARSIGSALAERGVTLVLTNRTFSKAQDLARDLDVITKVTAVRPEEMGPDMDDIYLVINCTSVGMKGGPPGIPLLPEMITEGMTVFDIVYNPMETPLIMEARKRGSKVIHGYKMLVQQGIGSYELWTKRKAPGQLMEKTVLDRLKENG